jgi:hypothetical protein
MSNLSFESDPLQELRDAAAAAAALAKEPEAFDEAFTAFLEGDASRFQAILDRLELGEHCHRICFLFCEKRCVGRCLRLCPERPRRPVEAAEVREFVLALEPIARKKTGLDKLIAAAESEDLEAWRAELTSLGLERFCHQVCHFLCRVRCKLICRELCARPLITRVSSMVTPDNFNALGFGTGPSIPPFQVPPPPPGPFPPPPGQLPGPEAGNHPIGGSSWLMGVFNFPAAVQYKIEVASAPLGPYSPITEDVWGWNNPLPPHLPFLDRKASVGADPGWYNIPNVVPPDPPVDPFRRGIFVSDGGPTAIGEKTLVYWTTSTVADGVYYLRLQARDGGGVVRVSAPQKVVVDNTPPTTPVISLQLKTPEGQLKDLKCGKVKQGGGLIRITIQSSDPNFSQCSVAAQGNSNLTIPVVAVPDPPGVGPAVPLSKTYNYNVADTGYPAPTSFLWDPWSDPNVVDCCYVVRIDIWDRAVVNNNWFGGHGQSGWEAIDIGF